MRVLHFGGILSLGTLSRTTPPSGTFPAVSIVTQRFSFSLSLGIHLHLMCFLSFHFSFLKIQPLFYGGSKLEFGFILVKGWPKLTRCKIFTTLIKLNGENRWEFANLKVWLADWKLQCKMHHAPTEGRHQAQSSCKLYAFKRIILRKSWLIKALMPWCWPDPAEHNEWYKSQIILKDNNISSFKRLMLLESLLSW